MSRMAMLPPILIIPLIIETLLIYQLIKTKESKNEQNKDLFKVLIRLQVVCLVLNTVFMIMLAL